MSDLRIVDIRKRFGHQEVLKGISFTFEPARVNMIIGPSGCGKSVLIKCMVGLIEPDAGEIYYGTVDFRKATPEQKREILKNLGMLFQSSALFDSMTVKENVAFPMRIFTRSSESEIRDRVSYCLERVGLYGVEDKYPAQLSGGMKRRVGLARAIVLNPKYLFCDEPNSGLDPLTARRIDELIEQITEDFHTTTIVVTHDIRSLQILGDKILFIYDGEAVWRGTREELEGNNLENFPTKLKIFLQASGLYA